MEIILVRHTTPNIEKGICYGQSDIDLASTFEDEIQQVLKQLPEDINNYVCYSSPLQRCKILAEAITSNITFDDRLKELNFGDWELKDWNAIDKEALDNWMNNFVTVPIVNGESYVDLHERTSSFIKEIHQQNKEKVIIVTHAGVMRSIHSFINTIPLAESFNLKLKYGEILHLNY